MVYKGAKYIRYLKIAKYLGGATSIPDYQATMNAKRQTLAKKTAGSTAVASQTAALTNQGGGNIGFTYE